jgi:hypothetical protein
VTRQQKYTDIRHGKKRFHTVGGERYDLTYEGSLFSESCRDVDVLSGYVKMLIIVRVQ